MEQHQKIVDKLQKKYESNSHVLAMLVTGSFARGEALNGNDLDVLLVTDGEKIKKEYKEGKILVELGSLTLPRSLDQITESPMFVYMYLDAKAVFDKGNHLSQFKEKAQEVLSKYKSSEQEKAEIRKWLESVVDKIAAAKLANDTEKIAFCVATNIWKMTEGLYMINSLPCPAFTSALRRVHLLNLLPKNFEPLWKQTLEGNLEERTEGLLEFTNFVLRNLT